MQTAIKTMRDHVTQADRCAALDGAFETAGRWLYRATLVVAPACYAARLTKTPIAAALMEATVAIVILLLLHWLAGCLLKNLHLVSEAAFRRPASWQAPPHRRQEPQAVVMRADFLPVREGGAG